jgi:hypothetical protein
LVRTIKEQSTYGYDLDVVLLVVAGMGSDEELLDGVVGAVRNVFVGHPLHAEGGPCKSVRIHGIVEERRILLPDLVLFHNLLLFKFVTGFH